MYTILAAYALGSLCAQAITCAVTARHATKDTPEGVVPDGITVLRPVSGLHPGIEDTIKSSFGLTGCPHEVIFCISDANDPAIPLVQAALAAHPQHDAKLLIGLDESSFNPKIDNLQKGWAAAKYERVLMVDSNVRLAPDTLCVAEGLRQQQDVGLVSSPPLAVEPEGFAAELETAFLNSHQLRWQLFSDALGYGFAQGKLLYLRKEQLGNMGLDALTVEYAEDAAATKVIRRQNMRVVLMLPPVSQIVGRRRLKSIWGRQERWAQLRWNSFSVQYLAEIFSGAFLPFVAAAIAFGWWALAFAAVWYLIEILMIRRCGWHLSLKQALCLPLRDVLLPVVWVIGLIKRTYEWNGHIIRLSRAGPDQN
ncbi:Ceramide glucosyltransferase [Ketogulonicigenium robustum]|uniref:Ceramide glucosyltransferase n=1 Tax=Ketogulonicigenium robustum TaxID=92947 RepID=A0A1W6P032_9RHOB|nr:glycosyltransferase [Ketogulonicigenium robustum]ARO14690.1 Ceramide glucosyltransferase [Ketogulonicigenium robustum]